LPKALEIRFGLYFEYLGESGNINYGYTVMFNINICRNNMDDVKGVELRSAHDAGIAPIITSTRRR